MKTKTITLFITLLLITANSIFAQHKSIKGKILDESDKSPVVFANVVLLDRDSVVLYGTSSDLDGIFGLKEIPDENYILSVSFIGYESKNLPIINYVDEIEILLKKSAISLKEVNIEAHSVIVKDDRKIIIPSEEQVKASTDGTDLMRKMQLPRIMVDPVSGEVTMSGNGEIQLRINGVLVTNAEIASIPPEDIIRIEYYDNPGARYGNADAVIDYITRKKGSGGNVNAVFSNNIGGNRTSADDRVSVKYNYGRSEFSANVLFVQRKQKWTREYDEKLIFPDYTLHRLEIGEPTMFNKKVFSTNLNYSLIEKNKYFFNAQFRYSRNDFPNSFEDRKSKLYSSDSDIEISIFDHTVEYVNSPALDLYFQRNLKNDQLLVFNVVSTYINTDSKRFYQETIDDDFLTNILSHISGNKYSLIGEGIYEKKIKYGKFTGGVKHIQAYTDNEYKGTTIANVSMQQAESSVYAEFQARTGKWNYMANITGVRLYFSQNDKHTEKYALQPSAHLMFEPVSDLFFRYRINLHNIAPSLTALNNIDQIIDAWQIRRGNPDLEAFRVLSQSLTTGYNKGIWGIDLLIGYDHEFNPIMESVFYENEKFVHFYENQVSFRNFSGEITFKFKPWKNHLSISVTPRIDHFISKGNDYRHTYTMPELRINVDFSYKNWLVNFTTITPRRYVYGEQLSKSDQMFSIMAGYKRQNWTLMVGFLNPFIKEYKTDNKNWSALNPVDSKIHTANNKSFLVKLAINLNYGKQFQGDRKRMDNKDTDSGIMQGGKQ